MRERMAIHGFSPALATRSPELNFSQKCQCADIDRNSHHHHQGPVDRLEVLRDTDTAWGPRREETKGFHPRG